MSSLFTFSKFVSTVNEGANKYEFACAMLFFTYPEMNEIHRQLDPADVYTDGGFGLETKPHCSLLAGLHKDVRPQQVLQTIQAFPIPDMGLNNVSTFPPRPDSPFEVLKFDVQGDGLHEINKALAERFPFTSPFPYHPHCTIAYLHKGCAAKYVDRFNNVRSHAHPEEIVYSKAGGTKMIRVFL